MLYNIYVGQVLFHVQQWQEPAHAAAVNDKNIVGSHKYAINISNGRYQSNKKKLL